MTISHAPVGLDTDPRSESRLLRHGDHRTALDPRTLRTSYGTRAYPEPSLWALGSCSASTTDPLGFEATCAESPVSAEQIRARLSAALQLPEGTAVVLCPSGTDACYLLGAWAKPHVTIVVGPSEVGRGTCAALKGRHFTDLPPFAQARRTAGALLEGWHLETEIIGVPLRTEDGEIRDDVDAQLAARLAAARGHDVLLVANAGSKTGCAGPSEALLSSLPPGIRVAVDAAQGRCGRSDILRWLSCGWPIVFTGSKFFGGPPFSGAVLFPPHIAPFPLPAGIADYLSREMLPWDTALPSVPDSGVLARWSAALVEIEAWFSRSSAERRCAVERFERAVIETLGAPRWLRAVELRRGIATLRLTGVSMGDLQRLHTDLRERSGYHLGQPLDLAPHHPALRLALGAPLARQIDACGTDWLRAGLTALWQEMGR